MKILLILLGCLAAVNGLSYYPYYYGSCAPRMPSKSCFFFKAYSCPAWYTCGYYRDIIKAYPDDACTIADDETVIVTDAEGVLEGKRTDIKADLDAKKKTFVDVTLPAKTKCFRDAAESYYTKYYGRLIECTDDADKKTQYETDRDEKIRLYNEDVDKLESDAADDYQTCIDDTMEKLEDFHGTLIEKFQACLTTRGEKIKDYEDALDERVEEYKKKYKEALEANREAREAAFKKVLLRCVDDEALADGVITHYCDEKTIDEKVTDYADKIAPNVEDLKKWYRCNYRCYVTCSYFNKRSYYCYSRQLGCWWSYKCTYTIPCVRTVKYTYKWTPCVYQCLKTCDPTTLHKTKEDVLTAMTDKIDADYQACKTHIETFFEDWKTTHASYVVKYGNIIQERHDCILEQKRAYYNCDGEITADEQTKLDDLKTELDGKKVDYVDKYDLKLKNLRDDGKLDAEEKLEDWKTCATEYATKLADKYGDCLTSIGTKKTEYEEKLTTYIADRRTCLTDNLTKVHDKNVESAECMIRAWIGEDKMTGAGVVAYIAKLKENIKTEHDAILLAFDNHWVETKGKLVLDYECKLRCGEPRFCFRKYVFPRCYSSWRVCYPTVYSYSYRCSYYVKRFYHHNVYGHYWC